MKLPGIAENKANEGRGKNKTASWSEGFFSTFPDNLKYIG